MISDLPFMDGPWRLAMGLRALPAGAWLARPAELEAHQLHERQRLLDHARDQVSAGLPGSEPAQAEALDLILDHLRSHPGGRVRVNDGVVTEAVTGQSFTVSDHAGRPLELAGRLVVEDLCLLEASDGAYRLTAAVLCFPSHWALADKLGRPLQAIHGPVPGYDLRLAGPVDRFFASIGTGRPVRRANWSLVDTERLFLPPAHRGTAASFDPERPGETCWLRIERQTLRRLPKSAAVLFTIRTEVHPLHALVAIPGAPAALAARVRELPEDMARYKGIRALRGPLLRYLDGLSSGGSTPSGFRAAG